MFFCWQRVLKKTKLNERTDECGRDRTISLVESTVYIFCNELSIPECPCSVHINPCARDCWSAWSFYSCRRDCSWRSMHFGTSVFLSDRCFPADTTSETEREVKQKNKNEKFIFPLEEKKRFVNRRFCHRPTLVRSFCTSTNVVRWWKFRRCKSIECVARAPRPSREHETLPVHLASRCIRYNYQEWCSDLDPYRVKRQLKLDRRWSTRASVCSANLWSAVGHRRRSASRSEMMEDQSSKNRTGSKNHRKNCPWRNIAVKYKKKKRITQSVVFCLKYICLSICWEQCWTPATTIESIRKKTPFDSSYQRSTWSSTQLKERRTVKIL